MSDRTIAVLSLHWDHVGDEMSFVTRSIAGAATRWARVTVGAPGPPGTRQPDGAFDVAALGAPGSLRLPGGLVPKGSVIVVDEVTPEIAKLVTAAEARAVFFLTARQSEPDGSWHKLHFVAPPGDKVPTIGLSVPVNPLAEQHRHHGFGFTDYLLVLAAGSGARDNPPAEAAWLTAAFPDQDVVVVEGGMASAWKSRALRGSVPVETRMDLWRLLAHARVCVDLGPGSLIARECVEALRFATPIMVAADSGPAAVHAGASGGATYAGPAELLEHTARLEDEVERSEAGRRARAYGDQHYGDPSRFVAGLEAALARS